MAPFIGARQDKASLDEVLLWLDKRALFASQWGLRATVDGPSYAEMVDTEGEPRLAQWLDVVVDLVDIQAVWGYWSCFSSGEDLIVIDDNKELRFSFPRQSDGELLCLADYFRDEQEMTQYGPDVVGFQLVTVGAKMSQRTSELFADNTYRDYFELHGLSVQLTEALAKMWHNRVRCELGLSAPIKTTATTARRRWYRGERFSFGYPSCPDLSQRRLVMDLLRPESIGVTLSEEFQLHPEQSTDALIVHHPQAHYFSVRSHE
jgi:5-methyltetrahydrofolate--homocysteine methyltransferase